MMSFGYSVANRIQEEYDKQQKLLGEVVVTSDSSGEIIAVTRQDEEGKVLSLIKIKDQAVQLT